MPNCCQVYCVKMLLKTKGENKMFICADISKDVKISEVLVVKYDEQAKNVGVFLINGEKVGEVSSRQAEGCIDFWTVASRIGNSRVLCKAVIKGGRLLIMSTESRVFDESAQISPTAMRCFAVV